VGKSIHRLIQQRIVRLPIGHSDESSAEIILSGCPNERVSLAHLVSYNMTVARVK
jgi:hypothetical protein